MAYNCGSPDCPERHGITLRPRDVQPNCELGYDLLTALKALSSDWRERARRARPLENARITPAKRAAIAEWICFSNRASELNAIIAKAEGRDEASGSTRLARTVPPSKE